MKMKALSLRQPWAWLVLHGGKDIENRVWNTHMRGPILIHASSGMTRQEYLDAGRFARAARGHSRLTDPEEELPPFAELKRGGLVGATTITGVLKPHDEARKPWHMPFQFGFELGPRVALPFRPLRGFQRWFPVELTDDEERVLRREGLIR